MDAKIMKLTHFLGDAKLAEALVRAGLDTPRKLKAAEDGDIEAAVGRSGLAKVRAVFLKA